MGSGSRACGIFAGLVIVLSSSMDKGQLAVASLAKHVARKRHVIQFFLANRGRGGGS